LSDGGGQVDPPVKPQQRQQLRGPAPQVALRDQSHSQHIPLQAYLCHQRLEVDPLDQLLPARAFWGKAALDRPGGLAGQFRQPPTDGRCPILLQGQLVADGLDAGGGLVRQKLGADRALSFSRRSSSCASMGSSSTRTSRSPRLATPTGRGQAKLTDGRGLNPRE